MILLYLMFFKGTSNGNDERKISSIIYPAQYWLEFQNQSKPLINNSFKSFSFVDELPHWYSFDDGLAQRTDILLVGYEIFVKAMNSNYKRLLSEACEGWRRARKLSPSCQRKKYHTNRGNQINDARVGGLRSTRKRWCA